MSTHRYILQLVLEAETPIFVGSGQSSVFADGLIVRDAWGFPMIPGTALAGVLRHQLESDDDNRDKWEGLFGFQQPTRHEHFGVNGMGSRLIVSPAYIVLDDDFPRADNTEMWQRYSPLIEYLPVRPHVRINHRGVADTQKRGLFSNEVLYKGVRFMSEIELRGTPDDESLWNELKRALHHPLFRIGQGTRKGYGKLKVVGLIEHVYDLQKESDFNAYLDHKPLDFSPSTVIKNTPKPKEQQQSDNLLHYRLELYPEGTFFFGSGYGDDEVDALPASERVASYDYNGRLVLREEPVPFIPASSIKGALRHRTCFHYNKRKQRWAEEWTGDERLRRIIEAENAAVYELFGDSADTDHSQESAQRKPHRGRVLINDLYLEENFEYKIFDHVAIDRFTGGALEAALYSEKAIYIDNESTPITIDIYVEDLVSDPEVIGAFEDALIDVCRGLLPLGGMTTKGHGLFTGALYKNNQQIYRYE